MTTLNKIITIDSSLGEGGGQILRTSLALSAILGMPLKVINIRAKRENPGLQHQHITAVKVVSALSNAKTEGLYLGSKELLFYPNKLSGGNFEFDVGTAGSVMLVLQAILPILPFLETSTKIVLKGGTDVPGAPTFDYFKNVTLELLKRIGIDMKANIKRRGYYPKGGGIVDIFIESPKGRLKNIELVKRGELKKIKIFSVAHKLPSHIAKRQALSAQSFLEERLQGILYETEIEDDEKNHELASFSPGTSISIIAEAKESILGGDSLGKKGKPAEKVGEDAAKVLIEDISTQMALDRFMSDMIIPFLALAKGKSKVGGSRLTLHAITNILIIEKILNIKAKVLGKQEEPFIIEVDGIDPFSLYVK